MSKNEIKEGDFALSPEEQQEIVELNIKIRKALSKVQKLDIPPYVLIGTLVQDYNRTHKAKMWFCINEKKTGYDFYPISEEEYLMKTLSFQVGENIDKFLQIILN